MDSSDDSLCSISLNAVFAAISKPTVGSSRISSLGWCRMEVPEGRALPKHGPYARGESHSFPRGKITESTDRT